MRGRGDGQSRTGRGRGGRAGQRGGQRMRGRGGRAEQDREGGPEMDVHLDPSACCDLRLRPPIAVTVNGFKVGVKSVMYTGI